VAHCTPRHWVARNLGLATSRTHSNCESLRRGARCLYVSRAVWGTGRNRKHLYFRAECLNTGAFIIARYLFVIYSRS